MIFKIIKKAPKDFWHLYNGDTKEVSVSDFQVVLNSVAQTFIIQCLNGANIPQSPVSIPDIRVIDQTDTSAEETFVDVEVLRLRLVQIGYTPYISATGIEEAPIDGNTYGRKDGAWIIVGGGASGFNKTVIWDGGTITVPTGYSGTLFNQSRSAMAGYSVVGTTLTVDAPDADTGDILQFTSN